MAELVTIVAQITTARDKPPRFAVRSKQPICNFKLLRTPTGTFDHAVHSLLIFRMHARKKYLAGQTFLRREAEELPTFVVHPRFASQKIDRPEREVG